MSDLGRFVRWLGWKMMGYPAEIGWSKGHRVPGWASVYRLGARLHNWRTG